MSIETEIVSSLTAKIASVQPLLDRYGLWALFVSCLVEGIGIPLPGETLLIACALMAGAGHLDLASVLIVAWVATQLGDILGFLIGRWGLKRLLRPRADQLERLRRAEALFACWGVGLLMVGRFLDGIRQTSNMAAGILEMPWRRFLFGTLVGTSLWVGTLGLGAYLLEEDFHALVALLESIKPYGLVLSALLVLGLIFYVTRRGLPIGKEKP
ncbi:MAG: DedA family protein [Chromatiaceae bacterium]